MIVYQSHELSYQDCKVTNSHPMLGTVPTSKQLTYKGLSTVNISEYAHCSMDLFIYLFIHSSTHANRQITCLMTDGLTQKTAWSQQFIIRYNIMCMTIILLYHHTTSATLHPNRPSHEEHQQQFLQAGVQSHRRVSTLVDRECSCLYEQLIK